MPPGRLPREVFRACPTGRRPRQDTLEGLCLWAGLGMSRNPPRSVGSGVCGEGILGLPTETAAPDKWNPNRLNDSSTFVLGSRANKALGMGGTRGRIYIKHADLFKYAADAKDKQWLAERHHMRATGGKMAYLLIEEDIQDLAQSDEYKDCPEVRMDEMKPFSVPLWMVEKMQRAMEAQRDAVSDP
uniref:TdIF1 C-terminal domain-containing protein n=1 Tax=Periophthalmus magnuspinnatus TaxID=409849 RepID=A0A3B4AUI5_9GOBI